MSRPEDLLPPDLYYNDKTSRSYTTSSRIKNIQAQMTYRALELLNLQSPSLILDVGCGSGLSGQILSSDPNAPIQIGKGRKRKRDEDEQMAVEGQNGDAVDGVEIEDMDEDGSDEEDEEEEEEEEEVTNPGGPHTWVGLDISASMLSVALEHDVSGDLFLADAGQGVPFRPGTFDACISISAIQWLCNAESTEETGAGRLKRFFDGLYVSLRRGGKAVLQFYAKDMAQKKMIADAAVKSGFGAGLLEDNEGTKNAKTYLVLNIGGGDITGAVSGMEGVDVEERRKGKVDGGRRRGKDARPQKGSKAWILGKKDRMERKGLVVKNSSKYTGRKRKTAF